MDGLLSRCYGPVRSTKNSKIMFSTNDDPNKSKSKAMYVAGATWALPSQTGTPAALLLPLTLGGKGQPPGPYPTPGWNNGLRLPGEEGAVY